MTELVLPQLFAVLPPEGQAAPAPDFQGDGAAFAELVGFEGAGQVPPITVEPVGVAAPAEVIRFAITAPILSHPQVLQDAVPDVEAEVAAPEAELVTGEIITDPEPVVGDDTSQDSEPADPSPVPTLPSATPVLPTVAPLADAPTIGLRAQSASSPTSVFAREAAREAAPVRADVREPTPVKPGALTNQSSLTEKPAPARAEITASDPATPPPVAATVAQPRESAVPATTSKAPVTPRPNDAVVLPIAARTETPPVATARPVPDPAGTTPDLRAAASVIPPQGTTPSALPQPVARPETQVQPAARPAETEAPVTDAPEPSPAPHSARQSNAAVQPAPLQAQTAAAPTAAPLAGSMPPEPAPTKASPDTASRRTDRWAERSEPASVAGPIAPAPASAVQPDQPQPTLAMPDAPLRPDAARPAHTLPIPTDARTVQSVVGQIDAAVTRTGTGTVEVSLSPKELGHVAIRIDQSDGALKVAFTFERPETTQLMRAHQSELSAALTGQGYSALDLSFADQRAPRRELPQSYVPAEVDQTETQPPPTHQNWRPAGPRPTAGQYDRRI